MPVKIGAHVHALPAPAAFTTKCGIPFTAAAGSSRPGQNFGLLTKARVTCPACRRIGSGEFIYGSARAAELGEIEDEEPEGER